MLKALDAEVTTDLAGISTAYLLAEDDRALARPGPEFARRLDLEPTMVPGTHESPDPPPANRHRHYYSRCLLPHSPGWSIGRPSTRSAQPKVGVDRSVRINPPSKESVKGGETKVLSLVFPGVTLVDLAGPLQALSMLPGVEHQLVGAQAGPVLSDAGVTVTATHTFADAWPDVDVLLVPGNTRSLFELLHDQQTAEFLADRGARAGWVTSVCTGSLLLGVAGLLDGYRAGCHWYALDLLAQYGAIPDRDRVVLDRNRMTGGGMTAGVDFGRTLLGTLAGEQRGRVAELAMEYAPQPPYGTGRPELADAVTLAAAQGALSYRMPLKEAPPVPLVGGIAGSP